MTIRNQNFEMTAGETRKLRATIRDENGGLVDLNNATVLDWVVRTDDASERLVIEKSLTDWSITGLGTAELSIVPEDTIQLCGAYKHECRLEDPTGTDTVFTGHITIHPTLVP